MGKRIVVVGSLNNDIILKVDRMPALGETMPANSATIAAGGKGGNQAAQAAKLGAETYMIGAVGSDSMGDFLLLEAKLSGINVERIKRSNQSTGMGIVHALQNGSVFATINRGANFDLTIDFINENLDLIKDADYVIIQNEIPMEINRYVIEVARKSGTTVLYNAAPAQEIERRYLEMCDIVIVNEVEASYYLGCTIEDVQTAMKMGAEISKEMGNTWIITLGSSGSVVVNRGTGKYIPPLKVNAVESTGAGDSYVGGLVFALSEGQDIFEGGEFATRCSAITVCGIGAQKSMPSLAEVMAHKEK